MTIDEMIAVLQAAKAGKQIQFQIKGLRMWIDCINDSGPDWNFESRDYRVKPEPREWWLNDIGVAYETREAASQHNMPDYKPVHVKEVL